jgi:hypothetical protein
MVKMGYGVKIVENGLRLNVPRVRVMNIFSFCYFHPFTHLYPSPIFYLSPIFTNLYLKAMLVA